MGDNISFANLEIIFSSLQILIKEIMQEHFTVLLSVKIFNRNLFEISTTDDRV